MQCFLEHLEDLSKEFKGTDTVSHESLLILLQSARESRITVFPRIIKTICNSPQINNFEVRKLFFSFWFFFLVFLFPSLTKKKFEEHSKKIEEQFITVYCDAKAKTYDQILKDTIPSSKYKCTDDTLEVGDLSKTILLQLVMDHAQIFGLVSTMTAHFITHLLEHILSSLFEYCSTHTEQILYNNDLAHQVCDFFSFFSFLYFYFAFFRF